MPYIIPGVQDRRASQYGEAIQGVTDMLLQALIARKQQETQDSRFNRQMAQQQAQMQQQQSQFNVGRDIDLQQLAEQIRQRKEAEARFGLEQSATTQRALINQGFVPAQSAPSPLAAPMLPDQIKAAIASGQSGLDIPRQTYQFPGVAGRYQQSPTALAEQRQKQASAKQAESTAGYFDALRQMGVPLGGSDSGLGQPTIQTPEQSALKQAQPLSTESMLQKEPVLPGQVLIESGLRTLGRKARMRETQKSLEGSYAAKTAQAARGFGDTANVAVEERKMMGESFPKDGDSYEGRLAMEDSLLGPNGFFNKKEPELEKLMNQQVPMIILGVSKNGPRYGPDPAILAQKKQAATDLARLKQTRTLYEQMYEEANRKMPPIGASGKPVSAEAQALIKRYQGK